MKSCNYCWNEDENAVLFWNDRVICEDELTHKNTKDYTCLCEDCKYKLEMDKEYFCEICYEPINEIKRVCGMCADNRVRDEVWTEEEKEKKMYKESK